MTTIQKGKIFAVSGSSGSGKTTLVNRVLKELPNFRRVKTYTTRPIRPGEKPGCDYHFISKAQFERRIKEGFFIEYSCAYGNYYGCAKSSINEIELGISLIYILDYQGCLALKAYYPQAYIIWIDVDLDLLRARLLKRGDKLETLERRLEIAKKELKLKNSPIFDLFIVNIDLKKSTLKLKEYMLKSSK